MLAIEILFFCYRTRVFLSPLIIDPRNNPNVTLYQVSANGHVMYTFVWDLLDAIRSLHYCYET